jgi:hypothetical protein
LYPKKTTTLKTNRAIGLLGYGTLFGTNHHIIGA